MAYRLAINGQGRIGQCVLQALYERQRTDASFPSWLPAVYCTQLQKSRPSTTTTTTSTMPTNMIPVGHAKLS